MAKYCRKQFEAKTIIGFFTATITFDQLAHALIRLTLIAAPAVQRVSLSLPRLLNTHTHTQMFVIGLAQSSFFFPIFFELENLSKVPDAHVLM